MKRERRKWTAAALAAVMTVTLLPFSAAADPQAEKAGVPLFHSEIAREL